MNKVKRSIFWNGQMLELETVDQGKFFTQIINKGDDLILQRPINKKNVPLHVQDKMPIAVYFYDDEQGLCTFQSKLFLRNNAFVAIKRPDESEIKKAQRRQYFRVEVACELLLSILNENKEGEEISLLTYDVSGGGLSFLTREKIVNENDLVKGVLFLQTDSIIKRIPFQGRIVNAFKLNHEFFRNSLQFIEMPESVRSEIIRFCLKKQIELRKKLNGELINRT